MSSEKRMSFPDRNAAIWFAPTSTSAQEDGFQSTGSSDLRICLADSPGLECRIHRIVDNCEMNERRNAVNS